jgi:hypothetical protein
MENASLIPAPDIAWRKYWQVWEISVGALKNVVFRKTMN